MLGSEEDYDEDGRRYLEYVEWRKKKVASNDMKKTIKIHKLFRYLQDPQDIKIERTHSISSKKEK